MHDRLQGVETRGLPFPSLRDAAGDGLADDGSISAASVWKSRLPDRSSREPLPPLGVLRFLAIGAFFIFTELLRKDHSTAPRFPLENTPFLKTLKNAP